MIHVAVNSDKFRIMNAVTNYRFFEKIIFLE